jgi:hypothetical protein
MFQKKSWALAFLSLAFFAAPLMATEAVSSVADMSAPRLPQTPMRVSARLPQDDTCQDGSYYVGDGQCCVDGDYYVGYGLCCPAGTSYNTSTGQCDN